MAPSVLLPRKRFATDGAYKGPLIRMRRNMILERKGTSEFTWTQAVLEISGLGAFEKLRS
jgi:hypothetical protein